MLACGAILLTTVVFAFRSYQQHELVSAIVRGAADSGKIRVSWSAAAPPPQKADYIHIRAPIWLNSLVSSTAGRWVAAPFCWVEEVSISNADSETLGALGECSSLRKLRFDRIDGSSNGQWAQILQLPLEVLIVINGNLPADVFAQLAAKNSIQNLTLAGEGPIDAHGLGLCTQLTELHLENIKGVADSAIASEIRQNNRLRRVDLHGKWIGDHTVSALPAIVSLEEIWLVDVDGSSRSFRGLSHCINLHTLCLSRCMVDDSVLTDLMGSQSLKRCILQGESLTPGSIIEFRANRPDVELTILSQLK